MGPSNDWPRRGVYFFFEPGEVRTGSGHGLRLVRIGTHALKVGARSTLYQRLRQHAGNSSGFGGNHRGSIFRLLIGDALIVRGGEQCPSWGAKGGINKVAEAQIEAAVSTYLGQLPFLCFPIADAPGPESLRGFIERNAIALASGSFGPIIDLPSPSWLGHSSSRDKVRRSGLWNQRHVDESYDPSFLDMLETAIEQNAKLSTW
ncbi:MAG: hypothetical protein HY059_19845 [Proteobacteria bacterium]|nr:hypothetical protein [Pseudomonadota bacterium]